MRRVAGCVALALAACPGCALTQRVWSGEEEKPRQCWWVWVSPRGDVLVPYTAGVRLRPEGVGLFWDEGLSVDAGRALVVPAGAMERLLARQRGQAPAVVSARHLRRYVHPRSPGSLEDGALEPLAGALQSWRQQEARKEPGGGIAFTYSVAAETDAIQAPGGRREIKVVLTLPERSSLTLGTVPIRILLTPPAFVADVVVSVPQLPFAALLLVFPLHNPDH